MYRQRRHQFLLVFPDGSRRLVPIAWTDATSAGPNDHSSGTARRLAGITELLQARTIVDALLRRIETEEEQCN
jgi:hypothetical protein